VSLHYTVYRVVGDLKAEVTKRRETEIAKLQRDLDESQAQNDVQLATYRKKHQDAVSQLTEQIDKMHAAKQRSAVFDDFSFLVYILWRFFVKTKR